MLEAPKMQTDSKWWIGTDSFRVSVANWRWRFSGWQVGRINRDFHLKRQMITGHIAARRRKIECVLLDVQVSCALRVLGQVSKSCAVARRSDAGWLVTRGRQMLKSEHSSQAGLNWAAAPAPHHSGGEARLIACSVKLRSSGVNITSRRRLLSAWNTAPRGIANVEHFLQAERLSAELGIVIFELAAFALFIFHRQEGAVGMPLDHVTFAGQTEPVGEDGQRAKERHVFGDFITRQVGVFMDNVAADSVHIFRAPAFNDFQPRPARAVEKVIQQGERQHLLRRRFWICSGRRHSSLDQFNCLWARNRASIETE